MKTFVGLLLALCLGSTALAEEINGYIGDEQCDQCHKLIKLKGYLSSKHGGLFTRAPRNSAEARGCEACHGPGQRHAGVAGKMEEDQQVVSLELNSYKPAPENLDWINATCLSCHQGGRHVEHWDGSKHQMNGVACTSCHRLHDGSSKVAQKTCESCHARERAKMNRSSHKPLNESRMGCTSCHNGHGSAGASDLNASSVNDTCFLCHAEKRGPFLWEHAPVSDNCSACHDSHGSNHERMLKMRSTYLCQTCHQGVRHTGALLDGNALVPNSGNQRALAAEGCLNCHSQIHGSNHPSGAAFQR